MSLFPVVPAMIPTKVTLSGGSVSAFNQNATASATVRVDQDGNVYYQKIDFSGSSSGQLYAATDWVRPTSAAPGLYQCRYTNLDGPPVSATEQEDIWHPLSTSDFFVSVSICRSDWATGRFLPRHPTNCMPNITTSHSEWRPETSLIPADNSIGRERYLCRGLHFPDGQNDFRSR
jgi:hypothetical protein